MTATATYLRCCWCWDLHSWSASWTCFDPFELQETASSLKVMIEWQVPELPMTLRLQARGRYLVQIDSVLFLSHHDCLVSHTRCTKTHCLMRESAKRRDERVSLSTPSKPRRKMQSPGQPLARWRIALCLSLSRALWEHSRHDDYVENACWLLAAAA
jgi:hypothetical protein